MFRKKAAAPKPRHVLAEIVTEPLTQEGAVQIEQRLDELERRYLDRPCVFNLETFDELVYDLEWALSAARQLCAARALLRAGLVNHLVAGIWDPELEWAIRAAEQIRRELAARAAQVDPKEGSA